MKTNKRVLTDKWYEDRFNLFKNYCFSSVKTQTNQSLTWLVYFDLTTPLRFKNYIFIRIGDG